MDLSLRKIIMRKLKRIEFLGYFFRNKDQVKKRKPNGGVTKNDYLKLNKHIGINLFISFVIC